MIEAMRALVLLVLVASVAHADQWVSPTVQTVKSPNGKVTATITPSKDGKSAATAMIGKTKITLNAPWMPVDTVVFDDGTLLTFDDWHSLGHGNVATFYERTGKVRWKKTLVQLLGKHAEGAQQSVSSIWWRSTPIEWKLATDGKSGTVTLFDEHHVRIELKDGASTIVPVDNLPDVPQRLVNRARALANRDGQEAAAAALLERVIAKEPTNFEALGLYVDLLQRSNDHARVIATLERVSPKWATQDGHSVANVSIAWAKSLQALAKTSEAERVLRLAVTSAPTYPNPAIALATLLVDQKRPKEADRVLEDFVARL